MLKKLHPNLDLFRIKLIVQNKQNMKVLREGSNQHAVDGFEHDVTASVRVAGANFSPSVIVGLGGYPP